MCLFQAIRRNDTCRATQPRSTTTCPNSIPTERRRSQPFGSVILENLPDGYEEVMQYGMISYIVPTSVLAETYNGQPLMYAALASQKRYMSLYLTNVYGDEGSAEWFRQRYAASGKKLNMGKSCVRFRKLEDLPLDVVGEAIALTPLNEFLEIYRASRVGRRK